MTLKYISDEGKGGKKTIKDIVWCTTEFSQGSRMFMMTGARRLKNGNDAVFFKFSRQAPTVVEDIK